MMIQAERKDGKIKQLDLPDSDLTTNAGVEDWSTPNDSNPDNTGIVLFGQTKFGEKKSFYLSENNLKMISVKLLLSTIAETEKIEEVPITSAEPNVIANTNAINKIVESFNSWIDFAIEESENI